MTTKKPMLITITGPSLTGKTTFANLLEKQGFEEVVSTTTRPQRKGEIEGKHYNFVTIEEFKKLKEQNLMIEEVCVNNNYYGVSRLAVEKVLAQGKNALIVVEPHGAQQIGQYAVEHNLPIFKIFLNNDTSLLLERFKHRLQNDEKADETTYKNRLWGMIMEEPTQWIQPAYDGSHHYDLIFENFTKENENEVIAKTLAEVSKKNDNKKKLRI